MEILKKSSSQETPLMLTTTASNNEANLNMSTASSRSFSASSSLDEMFVAATNPVATQAVDKQEDVLLDIRMFEGESHGQIISYHPSMKTSAFYRNFLAGVVSMNAWSFSSTLLGHKLFRNKTLPAPKFRIIIASLLGTQTRMFLKHIYKPHNFLGT